MILILNTQIQETSHSLIFLTKSNLVPPSPTALVENLNPFGEMSQESWTLWKSNTLGKEPLVLTVHWGQQLGFPLASSLTAVHTSCIHSLEDFSSQGHSIQHLLSRHAHEPLLAQVCFS